MSIKWLILLTLLVVTVLSVDDGDLVNPFLLPIA